MCPDTPQALCTLLHSAQVVFLLQAHGVLCVVQVLLWYASLYMIFLLAYGGGSGTWRYGLDVQKAKPAGALIIVPFMVFIFFCIW